MEKMTQAAVAREAGISEGFLSQILSGVRRPRWEKAKKLAKATETTPDLWLEGAPAEIREATGLLKEVRSLNEVDYDNK